MSSVLYKNTNFCKVSLTSDLEIHPKEPLKTVLQHTICVIKPG